MTGADAARQRDAVIAALAENRAAAHALAEAVGDPWYRAQALAWVARHADDAEVVDVARQAFTAASECSDPYQQCAAAAWPLRALLERGHRDEALALLEIVVPGLQRVAPASSRSEALWLLLQAVFEAGVDIRRSLAFALADLHDRDGHWRIERNLRDALQVLKGVDPEFAARLARGRDEHSQRLFDRAMAEAPRQPRAFFW